jgi:NADH:ubiquinone oxidoreductase subunit 6 (subunit J)
MLTNSAGKAFAVYATISLAAALIFLALTFITGQAYLPAARYGGAIWVLILSLIITMPVVIPALKKRAR